MASSLFIRVENTFYYGGVTHEESVNVHVA